MFEDKKFGTIFPTRTGTATGTANERQMLDAISGSNSFRTRIQNNPDGSVTMLRTKNGMPQFSTTAPTSDTLCKVGMDSGVVNLISASGVIDAHSNDAGALLRTDYVDTYLLNAPTDTTPIVDVIRPPSTKGIAPAIGATAKSFTKGSYTKKRIAVLCPPSLFTGKTRLYVQALYGRHESVTSINITQASGMSPSLTLSTGVSITTNCGVYLDPVTAKHYLISVQTSQASIYALVSTPCGEKLRRKLLDNTISAENKERIEAFILSQALPRPGAVATLTFTSTPATSMGYGWHFNWSGTCCDIVATSYEYSADPVGGWENESNHYRLEFELSGASWSVVRSVVEGPVRWKNYLHSHVIASPVWDFSGLEKLGTLHGPNPFGDAPFYVFYVKDEINVCRYAATTSHNVATEYRSPYYLNPGAQLTCGADAKEYRTTAAWDGVAVEISCGGATINYTSGAYSSGKSLRSSPSPRLDSFTYFSGSYTPTGTYYRDNGYPASIELFTIGTPYGTYEVYASGGGGNGCTYGKVAVSGEATFSDSLGCYADMTETSATGNTQIGTAFITAIPFNDAEAVYLLGTRTTSYSESGTTRPGEGWGYFGALKRDETRVTLTSRFSNSFSQTESATPYTLETDVTTVVTQKLVCSTGVVDGISIPTPGAFFNTTYTVVPVVINNYASANGTAAWSAETGLNEGNLPASLAGIPFTYVGWA